MQLLCAVQLNADWWFGAILAHIFSALQCIGVCAGVRRRWLTYVFVFVFVFVFVAAVSTECAVCGEAGSD